ncbi:MAG: bifunctional nicotinamidase/pyrazinamidase [Parachlamydia sp.]|nr:bifunctional nicotinamidase/pyrazinamidase [Parachlamydia sp.]
MRALLLVDIQNDFMPGGALGVKEGDQIIPLINDLLKKKFDAIVASKDWHPRDHVSFASRHHTKPGEVIELPGGMQQILWPDHCVQDTKGAEFAPGWDTGKVQKVFFKGVDREIDSYSAFFDNGHLRDTGLGKYLKDLGIDEIYIAGLTTEYCVNYSVHDAAKHGFKTVVILDACRGVNLQEGDAAKAVEKMRSLGTEFVNTRDI